ncbi:MAG: NAD(P)/FAD-dependent oxidoreductase [Bacteroidales bacterium]|nr:NAD(P)/FAD-dependent oxidoreductase [Bacteroidales bacterium]
MPDPIKSDITIIGAGPAGTSAALALAKKGIPCLLIDKYQFPREKICGDGLSGKVISTLNKIDPDYVSGLSQSSFASSSRAVRFYSPDLKMIELSFKSDHFFLPTGYVCKRIDFDHFLLKKALSFSTVNSEAGIHIEKLIRKDGTIILEDTDGRCIAETRMVLLAAGADRKLIQQLDPSYPGQVEEGIGIRGYFDNVTGTDQQNAIEIHFLKELLPWYLWIFPFQDGSANVGLALPKPLARNNPRSLKELLFHLIEKYPHLQVRFDNAKLNGKIEANRLPFYTGPLRIAGDNYLLLGDAARLIDPFTGEGIGNAMVSGYIAAEIASDCLDKNNFSYLNSKNYQQVIYKKLGAELNLGLKLQSLARKKRLLNLVIGRASRHENTRELLSEMVYSNKEKKKLSKTLFYLKLLLGL